jgi:hypothetical protein
LKPNVICFSLLSLPIIIFGAVPLPADEQATNGLFGAYIKGDDQQKVEIIGKLITLGDSGLPVLKQIDAYPWGSGILDETGFFKKRHERMRVLDAIAKIGTDTAADYLLLRSSDGLDPQAMKALARTNTKGLDRLLKLSKQIESYREPWIALEFRERKFIPFPKKQYRPTQAARFAREAIAFVSDPAAAPALGKLLDDQLGMRSAAFRALSEMRISGFEQQALSLWQKESSPVALRYLLTVAREAHLPLLQQKLESLDDEIARLLRNMPDLKARKVRDSIDDDRVVQLVFEMGGDPSANPTLTRYIESRLWVSYSEQMCVKAVMALGLSTATNARPTLLRLLQDSSVVGFRIYSNEISHWNEFSLDRYRVDGTVHGSGIPMFVIAATALQELGDPSVIPELEKAAALHNPRFKPLFERVSAVLHSKQQK